MSVDKFKFISPGIFIDEIDESALPPLPERMGPVIVGRFAKGPANRPVKVESFKEFVQLFGRPSAGNPAGDIWRTGALTAPTYAAYAVQAWLRNNSPCTVFRVLGDHPVAVETSFDNFPRAQAGWRTEKLNTTTGEQDIAESGGAYGLFVMPDPDGLSGGTPAVGTEILDLSLNAGGVPDGSACDFFVNIPITYGGSGNNIHIKLVNTGGFITGPGATTDIYIHDDASDIKVAQTVVNAINGTDQDNPAVDYAVRYGLGGGDHESTTADGIIGITASLVAPDAITITAVTPGVGGDTITWDNTADTVVQTLVSMTGGSGPAVTGTLGAIWYVQNGAVALDGEDRDGANQVSCARLIKSTNQQFTAVVTDGDADTTKAATFNFDKDSDLYIRKVFNTDPTKTNDEITSDSVNYWLGESFDSNVLNDMTVTGTPYSGTAFYGVILGLQGTDWAVDWADRLQSSVDNAARTGWFFSQDTRGNLTQSFDPTSAHTEDLFRFRSHDSGEQANRDFKISIQDIKVPTDNYNKYGTFSVVVRAAADSDSNPVILERFSGLNLDPTSTGYIKKVIGDRSYTYSENTKTITEHGDWPNRSKYVRVECKDIVDDDASGLLPYGVHGPRVPRSLQLLSGSTATTILGATGTAVDPWIVGSGSLPSASLGDAFPADVLAHVGGAAITCSLNWPTTRLRVSSSEGDLVMQTRAYFGYQSALEDTRFFDKTNLDLLRGQPDGVVGSTDDLETQFSWVFTLDDLVEVAGDSSKAAWVSGSRAAGNSITATNSSEEVLSRDWNRFTSPMFGGCDGLDVTEADPFRNGYIGLASDTAPTDNTNYAYYSMKKAIDILSDNEFTEFDVATLPGITNPKLVTSLINTCEDRADALAVVDIEGGYSPRHENTDTEEERVGDVDTTVANMKDLAINSSYGCTFYPWVRVKDNVNNAVLHVPPSVVALGTFSSSQRKSAVWFAPAGFTRGGLSEGSAGLPVIGVRERLTSAQRDKLYDANINPIASFPAEGIVIFGQKTMQVTRSALDRINVRRLLIYLKKEISHIASRILFDQNVTATWDKFTGQVVPFLDGVKAGLGLTDFRVVLDDTTTTPDLVDRNILYAKIYLKPARAIEFIALDFIITRSGASFDD
jgi:hypothetical protein